jgi:tetratricopeptide (TPR) repeat protein
MIAQSGLVNIGRIPGPVRAPSLRVKLFYLFLLLLVGFPVSSCVPKAVHIEVSADDVIRSNEVVKEADLAFTRKDHYAALIKYLEAAKLNPNSHIVYNKIGITYSQLKYYNEASAAFGRSIELNPKFSFAYNNLGSVYFATSELKKAEKYFRKAISLSPKTASFHVNLGSVYMEKRSYEPAMQEWQKALQLDPMVLSKSDSVNLSTSGRNPSERYYFLARLYATSGDVDRAVEQLQLALNAGFTDITTIQSEKDFDKIRTEEKFIAFMKTAILLLAAPK